MSTLRASAILARVCKSGWLVFVHHLETVTGSLPTCSASYRFVLPASAKAPLILFNLSMFIIIMFGANILIFFETKSNSKENLLLICIFMITTSDYGYCTDAVCSKKVRII